jgi:hypothetical protein
VSRATPKLDETKPIACDAISAALDADGGRVAELCMDLSSHQLRLLVRAARLVAQTAQLRIHTRRLPPKGKADPDQEAAS